MPSRPVAPDHFPGSQRCRKHPDRIARSIRHGNPVCEQCAFNDSFYGPGTSTDTDALNRRVENLELRLGSLTVEAKGSTTLKLKRLRWNATSQRRIEEVGRVLSELKSFRADFAEGDDYEPFARNHRDWLIFKIARKHSHWRERLVRLPNRVGRMEGMAQEMVADWHGVKKTTVRWDWTHRKASPTTAV